MAHLIQPIIEALEYSLAEPSLNVDLFSAFHLFQFTLFNMKFTICFLLTLALWLVCGVSAGKADVGLVHPPQQVEQINGNTVDVLNKELGLSVKQQKVTPLGLMMDDAKWLRHKVADYLKNPDEETTKSIVKGLTMFLVPISS